MTSSEAKYVSDIIYKCFLEDDKLDIDEVLPILNNNDLSKQQKLEEIYKLDTECLGKLYKLRDDDYAILYLKKKHIYFLEKVISGSIDKEHYNSIQNLFMYNLDALSMSYDKLKNKVITVTQKIDDEKFSKCIKIQDSEMNVDYIPQNMYTLFEEIQNLENKQNIIGKLVKLEENIKSKIHKIEESIKIKNNLVVKKSVNKNRTLSIFS